MPAPVVGGFIAYLSAGLQNAGAPSFEIWDGETPRFSTTGDSVAPSNTTGSWPVIKLAMDEGGFNRVDTIGLTGSYVDSGKVKIEVWDTTRAGCEAMLDDVEALMELQITISQPDKVVLGGSPFNPNYACDTHLARWWCGQDDGNGSPAPRTSTGVLLYRGDMDWDVKIKGTVKTNG